MSHPPAAAATLLLAIHPSVATSEAGLAELVVHTLIPMLDALEARPHAHVAWHMNGHLLDHLARHHEGFLLRLRPLVEQGQLEVLGGPFYGGIPALLSEADVRGQVAMAAEFWESILGAAPQGCMLPEMAWAAELPRLLQDTGIAYGVVTDAQLAYGQAVCPGWGRLERGGHSLFALCIDAALSAAFYVDPTAGFAAKLSARAQAAGAHAAPVSVVVNGEALGPLPERGAHTGLAELLDALAHEGVALRLPHTLLGQPGLAEAVVLAREYSPLVAPPSYRQAGRVPVVSKSSSLQPSQLGQWAQQHITSWAEFPARFAAADAMYRRMLRVSDRLKRAIERMEDEGLDEAWSGQLATAQRAVFRAQSSEGFGAGRLAGFVEPAVRDATLRAICSAEERLDGLMGASDAAGESTAVPSMGSAVRFAGPALASPSDLLDEELFVAAQGQLAWVSPKRATLRALEPQGQQRNLLDAWTEAELLATAQAQGQGGGMGDMLTSARPGADSAAASVREDVVPAAFCGPWQPDAVDRPAADASSDDGGSGGPLHIAWTAHAQLPGDDPVALRKRIALPTAGIGVDWHIEARPAGHSAAAYSLQIPLRPSASATSLEIDQKNVSVAQGQRDAFTRIRVLAADAPPVVIACEPADGWQLAWQPGVGGALQPGNGGIVLTLSRPVGQGFAATVTLRA